MVVTCLENFLDIRRSLSFSRAAATSLATLTDRQSCHPAFRVRRVHHVIAKLDESQLVAEWCQQSRPVGLRSYDDPFVVEDRHRPVLEPWATPRGSGSGSSLVDGVEVPNQSVAVLRAPLPEVIGNDSKLPAWSFLVDEFRHAVTPCSATSVNLRIPKISVGTGAKMTTRSLTA